MDKSRAVAARVAAWVTRSRPRTAGRAFGSGHEIGDDQRGQGLAEYALLLSLLAIVAIAALLFLGTSVSDLFEAIINEGFRYVQTLVG